jgi:hypothetical protein
MAVLEFFTLTATLNAIVVDYLDADADPDVQPISATVEFRPRIGSGKLVWLPTTTPPQGVALPGIKARFDTDGVLRTIQDAAVNESQHIVVTGNPFTVSFKSVPTGNLSSTATAAQVETAITGLSTVGASNAAVSGPNGGPFDVVFNDALGDQDVPQMTATNATITTTRAGTLAAGVKLTAGTDVLGLGTYNPQSATGGLVYDCIFSQVVYNKKIQTIDPFGIVSLPEWAGQTIDLAEIPKVPPLAGI